MRSTIERAMDRVSFDVEIDRESFSKMSAEDQELTVNSMTKKEQFENLNNLKLVSEDINGLVFWNNGK